MGDLFKRLLAILNTADAGSTASKGWNIVVSIVAAAALIVGVACKLGIPVPGVPCAQVGALVAEHPEVPSAE